MVSRKRVVLVHAESPSLIILTSYTDSSFTPSIGVTTTNALTMFSMLLMVVLMGSLPTLTHSWAPIASVTQLYANETASQHPEANYKDSWLGWVSISRGCHSFLTALGCMACLGSIKFVSRLSGCVEHVLSHHTD